MKWKKSLFCHRSLLSLSPFSLLFCRPKLSNKEKKVTEVLSFFYYLPHRVVFVCACVSRLPTNFLTFAALWRRKEKKRWKEKNIGTHVVRQNEKMLGTRLGGCVELVCQQGQSVEAHQQLHENENNNKLKLQRIVIVDTSVVRGHPRSGREGYKKVWHAEAANPNSTDLVVCCCCRCLRDYLKLSTVYWQ